MHERLNSGIKFCIIGNILFLAFSIVCFIFYTTYNAGSLLSAILEYLAYGLEFSGFGAFIFGDWLISSSIRFRGLMKLCLTLYIILEAVMMVLELNAYRFEFYRPYSRALAIFHSAISGFVCLTFLQLDKDKKKLELMVIICIAMMFAGMFGNILGIRIYFSILVNAVAYAVMFYSIARLIRNDEIEVDCHGDRARVAEFKSTIVDD
ncbi:hypothetical protein [Ruminococcus flavefaciens]|jgi:hypothetical protein|uniref:Uncharacterized protein n=1 Tax=Ruminococcus flavefaciens TaxID=1265 RepID=A0A1K1N5I1_RUMFL|nr:hypothetical protein [Ruminococcus flavefaciens]SFW30607.1 hypothetical protein SAMN02910280_1738 [Ruminococcus flavefaciens]